MWSGTRYAAISGLVGGFLWAVTPLRQPIFDAGRSPDEGETFFRVYNLVLVAAVILLTVALGRLRREAPPVAGRLFATGWWTILAGHVLIVLGSVPAVILGDRLRDLVMGGQDLGFVGAMIAGLGGFLVGCRTLRGHRNLPAAGSWMLLLTLPLGFALLALLSAMGVPEDYLGLPLTVLYGGAWVVFGASWLRGQRA